MSYRDEVMDTWSAYCANVPREYAITIAARADAEIAALRAEVAGLRADALRYRWLRSISTKQSRIGSGFHASMTVPIASCTGMVVPVRGDDLDAAIDAAMGRKGGGS